jgi:radical SAM protein with 4Fe4S-binding SPASM domain
MSSGLVYVVWEVTLQCDLACKHCGSRAGKPREDELTTAEALEVVRQLKEMGTQEITLIGGEAYLREDWHLIARAIKDHGMQCTMTTGGRGMTKERARLAFESGIDNVSVSVDGLEAAHDLQRGVKGSWKAAMQGIDNLLEAGCDATINTQINRISRGDLDALLDILIGRRMHAWQVQMTVPMGRAADRPEWLLQPYELVDLFPKLAELALRGAESGVFMWAGNNVGYFGPHEQVIRGRATRTDRHWEGCTAGKHTLGIEADGAIKGCPSLPTSDYVGGHVRERSIRDIWDTTKELRFTRDQTSELWGFCKGCYYADVCRGGCTWTSHVFFGKSGNNPYCHHRALEHKKQGLRERLVRAEKAPGAPFDYGIFEIVVEPDDSPAGDKRRLPVMAP